MKKFLCLMLTAATVCSGTGLMAASQTNQTQVATPKTAESTATGTTHANSAAAVFDGSHAAVWSALAIGIGVIGIVALVHHLEDDDSTAHYHAH